MTIFYVFQKKNEEYRLNKVNGLLFRNKTDLKQGDDTISLISQYNLEDYLGGDILWMYSENGELHPIPRKHLVAHPSLDPELINLAQLTQATLDENIVQVKKVLEKINDPKLLQIELEPLIAKIMQNKDNILKSTLQQISNSSNIKPNKNTQNMVNATDISSPEAQSLASTYPVIQIHITLANGNADIFKPVVCIGSKSEEPVSAVLDTLARKALVSPQLANKLKAPRIGKVILSGIEEGRIEADVAAFKVKIENIEYPVEAAVFPPLERILKTPFLIDQHLYRAVRQNGGDFK